MHGIIDITTSITSMAVVKFRRTKLADSISEHRADTSSTRYTSTAFKSAKEIANYCVYLNSKKEYNISPELLIESYGGDIVDDTTRVQLVIQDVIPDEALPYNFLHLPPKQYQQKVRHAAELYAEQVVMHNEYYRKLNGDKSENEEKEMIFSFAKSEMAGLNLAQIRDRVDEYVDAVNKPFIGSSWRTRKPWIQIHAKPNGIVDVHCLLAHYDNQGQALRSFETVQDLEEKSNIMYRLEHDPKFAWLEKTITDSWIKEGKLTTPEQVPDEVATLKSILSATPNRPDLTHRALIDAGAKITAHRYGSKTEFTKIDFNGRKFVVNQAFDSELNIMLSKYIELKDFAKDNRKLDVGEVTSQLTEIINKMKGKSLEELNNELLKEGICIKLNPNKAKQVRGISFDFGNSTTIKSSRIGFKVEDFKTEYHTYNNLLNAHEKFSEVITEIKHQGVYKQKNYAFIGNGKRTDFSTFEEWRMRENESLFAFQRRMRASNNSKTLIALSQYEIPSPFANILYHNYNGRKKKVAEILSDKSIRVFNNTDSALKAGLQLFHAQNRLTQEEMSQGYKHRIEISGTNLESLNRAWLQAKLLGYEPVVKIKGNENSEFTPNLSTMEKYEAELLKKRDKHRKDNVANLKNYFSTDKPQQASQPVTEKKHKLMLGYFSSLGNDIDRSAMALTYLDAFKLGVDSKHLFNPPLVHNSRNRLARADLVNHYDLILATARKEIPDQYAAFKAGLDKAVGKTQPSNVLQTPTPPVTATPLPPVSKVNVKPPHLDAGTNNKTKLK